jgi:hypothetical protein
MPIVVELMGVPQLIGVGFPQFSGTGKGSLTAGSASEEVFSEGR